MGLLRSAGLSLHRCFTWNPGLARLYLGGWYWGIRRLPPGWLRTHLASNLRSAAWPQSRLAPALTELPWGPSVWFSPRPGSRAFRCAALHGRVSHEPEVYRCLAERLHLYDAVVEIGANVGLFTVLFSKRLPDDGPRVFAFEPSQWAFQELLEHLELNACRNVQAFNCAVAPGAGLAPFYENNLDLMKGSLESDIAHSFPGGGARQAPVLCVGDNEILQLVEGFERILLKVDVVGAEASVLVALRHLVERRQPDMILGVSDLNLERLNGQAGLPLRGYALFKIDAEGLTPRAGFEDKAYCNYLLTPAKPDGRAP